MPTSSPAERLATGPLLVRTDATPRIGVGHAMRCLALAQEVRAQGRGVVLAGELDVPWVREAWTRAGVTVLPAPGSPADLVTLARELDAAAVLLDGYLLDAADGAALVDAGFRVGAMVDAEFGRHQVADVYVDQNPGSTPAVVEPGRLALAGADYTLFRDDVLTARERRAHDLEADDGDPQPLRVLAVFGGTDPLGAAPVVAPLVVEAAERAGYELDLEVVTQDVELATSLQELAATGSRIRALPSVPDLARRAAAADLVVTASGSTVWELLCIGVPAAVVCVVDNQAPGYEFSTSGGFVTGVGHLDALRSDTAARRAAVDALREAMTDTALRDRRATAGLQILDGRGRRRVAQALLGPVSRSR